MEYAFNGEKKKKQDRRAHLFVHGSTKHNFE